MDSSLVRMVAQVAMTTWAITQIALLVTARGRVAAVTGVRWAALGLVCFASWMFLLSVSGVATGPDSSFTTHPQATGTRGTR
jgi:hypothetical protein